MSLSDEKRRYIDSIDKEETYDFYSEEKVKKHTQAFIERLKSFDRTYTDLIETIDKLAAEEFGDLAK